jgi:hypothetical protein
MNSHNELLPYEALPSGELSEGQQHVIVLNDVVQYAGLDSDVARLIFNSIRIPLVSVGNIT